MDIFIFHACVLCDTLSSRTAPKESSFDHCVPLFAISSKLVHAGRPKRLISLLGHLFFNLTNVFCAKKRVGHACICPRRGWSLASRVLKLGSYTPPPKKLVLPRPEKRKFPTENGMRTPTFEKKISGPFFFFFFFFGCVC